MLENWCAYGESFAQQVRLGLIELPVNGIAEIRFRTLLCDVVDPTAVAAFDVGLWRAPMSSAPETFDHTGKKRRQLVVGAVDREVPMQMGSVATLQNRNDPQSPLEAAVGTSENFAIEGVQKMLEILLRLDRIKVNIVELRTCG